jgi:hypothetical protein
MFIFHVTQLLELEYQSLNCCLPFCYPNLYEPDSSKCTCVVCVRERERERERLYVMCYLGFNILTASRW